MHPDYPLLIDACRKGIDQLIDSHEEFCRFVQLPKVPGLEKRIVFSLLNDLMDRLRLAIAWDGIRDEAKEEIIGTWCDIVKEELTKES